MEQSEYVMLGYWINIRSDESVSARAGGAGKPEYREVADENIR